MKVYKNLFGDGSKINATEISRKKDTVPKTLEEEIVRIDDNIVTTNTSITTLTGRVNDIEGVTPQPVVVLGSNLFNRSNPASNYDINPDGTYFTHSGYAISDYITVTPGKVYITKGGYGCSVGMYDTTGGISRGWASIGSRGFVPTYNTAKIRVICKMSEIETFGVYELIVTNKWTATGITAGSYVDYSTGSLASAAGYNASAYIPVGQYKRYMASNNEQLAFYNSSYVFIEGFVGGANQGSNPSDKSIGVYAPKNAAFVRLSVKNADLTTMSFAELGPSLPIYRSSFTVRKDMYGDFSSINEAIYYAKTFAPQKIDLLIASGIYEERIDMIATTNVNLIGQNKQDTIIIDKQGTYVHCTLTMTGQAYIANLTFISNHDSNPGFSAPYGYAMHFDAAGPGKTVFENCIFKSYQNAAVGIGMHQDQILEFKNCEMYSDSTVYGGGALYFHNAVASGVTNQFLNVENCVILTERGHAIICNDANINSGNSLGNDMTVRFINNIAYSRELGLSCFYRTEVPIGVGTFVGNVKHDPMSFGNNLSVLNY